MNLENFDQKSTIIINAAFMRPYVWVYQSVKVPYVSKSYIIYNVHLDTSYFFIVAIDHFYSIWTPKAKGVKGHLLSICYFILKYPYFASHLGNLI